MIKRNYFIRAKIAHNDNSGSYSWWSGVMVLESWIESDGATIFNNAMSLAHKKITPMLQRTTHTDDVEIESLNKI